MGVGGTPAVPPPPRMAEEGMGESLLKRLQRLRGRASNILTPLGPDETLGESNIKKKRLLG